MEILGLPPLYWIFLALASVIIGVFVGAGLKKITSRKGVLAGALLVFIGLYVLAYSVYKLSPH